MSAALVVRVVVVVLSAGLAATAAPTLGVAAGTAAAGGALLAVIAIWLEKRAERVALDRLLWGATGGVLGLLAGLGVGMVTRALAPAAGAAAVALPALLGVYLGAAVAVRRGGRLTVASGLVSDVAAARGPCRILDTSSIIDGRIADVCETGFVDGVLVVPEFVLRELQQIADSPDALKRSRGKRGFEVLQRLQRVPGVTVEISDLDYPGKREVDQKLVELAKALGGRILTNDGNLGKLAELSGVGALNVNELATALRPVALPGEVMQVQVVREGKEVGQGVAYLDDGTMVVVEHGRKHLGQTVGVTVTSVLQTSAGRMIFTRPREEEPSLGSHDG